MEDLSGFDFAFSYKEDTNTHFDDNLSVDPLYMDNIVFLLDTSGSMGADGQAAIRQLNTFMPLCLQKLENIAFDMEVDMNIRIISFNRTASWLMGSTEQGVPIRDAIHNWKDLTVCDDPDIEGGTDIAGAICLARSTMSIQYLGTRNYHPIVILVSDGDYDNNAETKAAIEELRSALSGGDPQKKDKVWRIAVGAGNDCESTLLNFAMIGTEEDEWGYEQTGVPMLFHAENPLDAVAKVSSAIISMIAGLSPVPCISVDKETKSDPFDDDDVLIISLLEDAEPHPVEDEDPSFCTRACNHVVFLLENSGSVEVEQLNDYLPDCLIALKNRSDDCELDLKIRMITFNQTASWLIGNQEQGVPVREVINNWTELPLSPDPVCASGTDIAGAIRLANSAMDPKYLRRAYAILVILCSAGKSMDPEKTRAAIEELRHVLSGHGIYSCRDRVWRCAVGVGDYSKSGLEDFAMKGTLEDEWGNEQMGVPMVFQITDPDTLARCCIAHYYLCD